MTTEAKVGAQARLSNGVILERRGKRTLRVEWRCGDLFSFDAAKVRRAVESLRDGNLVGVAVPVARLAKYESEADDYWLVAVSRARFSVAASGHPVENAVASWTFREFLAALDEIGFNGEGGT
jgi:hypothetical protein